jgi:hypothetical protein
LPAAGFVGETGRYQSKYCGLRSAALNYADW